MAPDAFAIRQLAHLALTANAVQPPPTLDDPVAIPSFFAGWLTTELSPHLAALTVLDAARELRAAGPASRVGLAAAVATLAGHGVLLRRSRRAESEIEDALVQTLGAGYRDALLRERRADDDRARWTSLAVPFRSADPDVVRRKGIAYADGGRRFELDVYHHRDTPSGAPVLLQVHGGAWMIGNKNQQGIPLMQHMAARGWVCVAPNYPLSPRSRWPAHIVALKRALVWTRQHVAEFGGDPGFVATTGGSAGGHLAALLALTPNDPVLQPGFEQADTSVQASAPHYGVYDFTAEGGDDYTQVRIDTLIGKYVMAKDAAYPRDYRDASPHDRVRPDAPPFLIVHGSHDTMVPVIEARRFAEKLRTVSTGPVVYAEIGGAQHAFDTFASVRSAAVARGVARFLEWTHATREQRPQLAARG